MSISSIGGSNWSYWATQKAKAGQNLPGNSGTATQSGAQSGAQATDPASLLANGVQNSASAANPSSDLSGGTDSGASAVDQFQSFMKETPAQRMLSSWLDAHGMTLQQFNSLSPEEQQKIMREMEEDLKNKMKQQAAAQSRTDILV